MVALLGSDDVQAAELVMSCVEPSLNLPIASNCCVAPRVIDGLLALTVIEVSVGVELPEDVAFLLPRQPLRLPASNAKRNPTRIAVGNLLLTKRTPCSRRAA